MGKPNGSKSVNPFRLYRKEGPRKEAETSSGQRGLKRGGQELSRESAVNNCRG